MPIVNAIFFTLFCSAFVGSFLRIGPLYPLRVFLPIALISVLYVFFHKKKTQRKLSGLMKYTFFYVFIFYVFTLGSSFMGVIILDYFPNLNDVFNFTILFLFLVSLWKYSIVSKDYLRVFKMAVIVMYFVYLTVSILEIITGFHFQESISKELNINIPTTFFVNPNDFAAIFTLMLMFLMTVFKNKYQLLKFVVVLIHVAIVFYTGSRLSLLVFMLFLFIHFKKVLKYAIPFSGVVVLFYFSHISDLLSQIIDMMGVISSFGDRSSVVRFELYKESLSSVFSSFGLGFGVNSSQAYLEFLNNKRFLGITNPHSAILELLINSGLLVFLLFVGLNMYVFYALFRRREFEKSSHVIFYTVILFSSSSSLFLWPAYLFLMAYVTWAEKVIIKGSHA